MRMYDLIMKKRNGGELTGEEIDFFVKGYTKGEGNTTNKNTYDKTISAATDVKNLGAEIFSIGYMLPAKSEYDYKSAETILTEVSSPDKEGSTFTHYVNADPEKVANAFTNIAKEMSTASAGTNAVLTDNIGGKFTLTTDSTARSYVSEPIANITETGTTLSFYVDIDKDAPNIRRLVIHELGPVKGHRKQVITSEIKNKIKQL